MTANQHPAPDSLTIPWRWEWHDQVDSTNRLALESLLSLWSRGESAQGMLIAARRQSAGRGQHGRHWASPEGGLYMSAVVENIPADIRGKLALVAGVAVAEALVSLGGFDPKIRWPNDVLLRGKKVAGILCEAAAQGERWAAVIGIGVNVNTLRASLPEELRVAATSLFEEDHRERLLEEVAESIATGLGRGVLRAAAKGISAVVERVRSRDALKGGHIRLNYRGEVISGCAAGVADDGSLLLSGSDGSVRAFSEGSLVREPESE